MAEFIATYEIFFSAIAGTCTGFGLLSSGVFVRAFGTGLVLGRRRREGVSSSLRDLVRLWLRRVDDSGRGDGFMVGRRKFRFDGLPSGKRFRGFGWDSCV